MQVSIFDFVPVLPLSHDEAVSFWHSHLKDIDDDIDAFTWDIIKHGHSYYFYGTRVFHVVDGKFKLAGACYKRLSFSSGSISDGYMYTINSCDESSFSEIVSVLRQYKNDIFRSLITETFACCNSFRDCSSVGHCIKTHDRFYNGCIYRSNLEAGRNFYKE